MEWPQGELTRIPYWIYQSPEIYALEQKRVYEGPVWNYLCLEAEVAKPGDYRTTFVGSMPVWWCATSTTRSTRSRTAARIAAR